MFAGRPIIGISGGIGAGKSHLARLWEPSGVCRIASDEMVAAAYTHPEVKRQVVSRFGEQILDGAGRIDRRRIAGVVFRDAGERVWLEKLLHPVANRARVEVMEQAARDPRVRAFAWDSPLLFETKLDELCDTTVFVDAAPAERAARVASRGWADGELQRREAVQMPLDMKRSRARWVIPNTDAGPLDARSAAAWLDRILLATTCTPGSGGCGGCGGNRVEEGAAGGETSTPCVGDVALTG